MGGVLFICIGSFRITTYKLGLIFAQQSNFPLNAEGVFKYLGFFLFLQGLVLMGLAISMWRMKQWAWMGQIVIYPILWFLSILTSPITVQNLIGFTFNLIIIIYMCRSRIRNAFLV
ncbi:MAG: hypothetical protein EAZ33_04725 [Oscillatoriales cyanobacterium]|nr:MAG: hypothetical protein EAZ33_04725 [Oscillatoriales cyanobacterium]TAG59993.1 MAG: hypothetical protein EAZ28_09315 [Oscillatoriales cyanobacterium]